MNFRHLLSALLSFILFIVAAVLYVAVLTNGTFW